MKSRTQQLKNQSDEKNGKGPELETLLFKVDVLLADDEFEEVKNNLIIPQIKVSKTDYVDDDIAYVAESLDQNLKFGFILDTKEDLINLTSELTHCSYKDFPEICSALNKNPNMDETEERIWIPSGAYYIDIHNCIDGVIVPKNLTEEEQEDYIELERCMHKLGITKVITV